MVDHTNHLKPFETSKDGETVENAHATKAEPQLKLAKGGRALKQTAIAKESKQARAETGLKTIKRGVNSQDQKQSVKKVKKRPRLQKQPNRRKRGDGLKRSKTKIPRILHSNRK